MTYAFDPVVQLAVLTVAFGLVHLWARSHAFQFAAHSVLFVLLTAILLLNDIEPYSPAVGPEGLSLRLFYAAAKAVWWIGGALMLVSSVRAFLIFEGRPREAKLIQDLIAGLLYVGAVLAIVAYVFNVPVGTLIATSGVVAVILGLALQSTLSDVFSGIALNLGRPYAVGDWIILDTGVQGRVVETNWRATHLLNGANDLVVVPNTTLAKSQLTNMSSPDETHGVTITVRVATTRGPSWIRQVFETILLASRSALQNPAPLVSLTDMDGQSINVELAFRVAEANQIIAAKNEMYDLIFRHLSAVGLTLSVPSTYINGSAMNTIPAGERRSDQFTLVRGMPIFAQLSDAEVDALASSLVMRDVAAGQKIIDQGDKSPTLLLVGRGAILVERISRGRAVELNRLSPGDFLGERGVLMETGEPGTIKALCRSVVYEVPLESLTAIMHDRPALAEELGAVLAARLESEALVEGDTLPVADRSVGIAYRIRRLFRLPTHQ